MNVKISEEEYFELVSELNHKYGNQQTRRKGEINTYLLSIFAEDTEEEMIASILNYQAGYKTIHILKKIKDGHTIEKLVLPKQMKETKHKQIHIKTLMQLKRKYPHIHSKQEVALKLSKEYAEVFEKNFDEKCEIHAFKSCEDTDNLNRFKKMNIDEFTAARIKKYISKYKSLPDLYFIKIKNKYYDVETEEGVSNPLHLKRTIKEMRKGEREF